MNEQKDRFVNFILHFWADYHKFTGASRICVGLLNFFLLIFKMTVCVMILIICAPHLVANNLLNKQELSFGEKTLYLLMVIVGLCIDVLLLIGCVMCVMLTYQEIATGDFLGVCLYSIIFLFLIMTVVPLVGSLFCKSKVDKQCDERIACIEDVDEIKLNYEDTTEKIEIDSMSGTDFENFCSKLLVKGGYTNICLTDVSGDHGIDILAEKDDLKWGLQCKRWRKETHIGNDVIQKTFAGKAFYHCDIAVVITTTTFTRKAEEYARETGIILWGRDKLYDMMKKANYNV